MERPSRDDLRKQTRDALRRLRDSVDLEDDDPDRTVKIVVDVDRDTKPEAEPQESPQLQALPPEIRRPVKLALGIIAGIGAVVLAIKAIVDGLR